MATKARVFDWNGKDLPSELQRLPAGRYVVERIEAPTRLSPEDEEAIRAGLRSIDAGRTVDAKEVLASIKTDIKRRLRRSRSRR